MIIGQGVVGGPRITDPRGSKPPPPPNHLQITDHPPHNPPPLPPKMIRNARTYSPHLSMQGKPHFFRLHCDSQTNSGSMT